MAPLESASAHGGRGLHSGALLSFGSEAVRTSAPDHHLSRLPSRGGQERRVDHGLSSRARHSHVVVLPAHRWPAPAVRGPGRSSLRLQTLQRALCSSLPSLYLAYNRECATGPQDAAHCCGRGNHGVFTLAVHVWAARPAWTDSV